MSAVATMTDAQVKGVIRAAMCRPSSPAIASRRFGLSQSHLYGILNGNAPIGPTARQRILAEVREDEIALADKIAAEWGW